MNQTVEQACRLVQDLDVVVDFRIQTVSYFPPKVRLLDSTGVTIKGSQSESSLSVLWIPSIGNLFDIQPAPFRNLVSLKHSLEKKSQSEWRIILESSSKTLKHLSIRMEEEVGDAGKKIPNLHFQALEVLELYQLSQFPFWISAPPTLKLETSDCCSGVPPLSELQLHTIFRWESLANCPKIETLWIFPINISIRSWPCFELGRQA